MQIIPILILLAVFSLGLRLSSVWTDSQQLDTYVFSRAEAASDSKKEDKESEDHAATEEHEGDESAELAAAEEAEKADQIPELLKGLSLLEDEGEFDLDFARSEIELLQNLSERRKQLDTKEEALGRKEAVLRATEQQIEQKIAELTSLKEDLKGLLKEQGDQESKRIGSLVKIYEGMKPSDAANILNALETDILISVMERMSERKSAPILANMDPDRAREVTTLLAERKQLPNLDL